MSHFDKTDTWVQSGYNWVGLRVVRVFEDAVAAAVTRSEEEREFICQLVNHLQVTQKLHLHDIQWQLPEKHMQLCWPPVTIKIIADIIKEKNMHTTKCKVPAQTKQDVNKRHYSNNCKANK